MADRPVEVQLPDGRTLRGRTDAVGQFPFTLATEGFSEAQTLRIVARLPEDEVEAAAVAALAVLGFTIAPRDRPLRVPQRRAVPAPRGHPRRHRQTDRPGAVRLGDPARRRATRRSDEDDDGGSSRPRASPSARWES